MARAKGASLWQNAQSRTADIYNSLSFLEVCALRPGRGRIFPRAGGSCASYSFEV